MGRSDSALEGRVIFAVGSRRSGTNWIQRVLTAAPDVVGMPTETYLFQGLEPLTERFQHGTPGLPNTALTFMPRDAFLDAVREFTDRVFEENLRAFAPDARYLVERTPWHVYNLALIAAVYPEAPVVHIIRDGRDVARSLLSKSWGPARMEAAAEEWRSSVSAGRSVGRSLPNYVEVFYERLLAEPESEIPSLYEQLGLDLGPDVLEAALLEARTAFNVDPAFPTIGSGKWRSGLSPSDLRIFERIAGPLLEELGYEREPPGSGSAPAAIASAATTWARAGRLVRRRLSSSQTDGAPDPTRVEPDTSVLHHLGEGIAEGRLEVLDRFLAPDARIRLVDPGETWAGRGPDASTKLGTALEAHRKRGLRLLTGDVHRAGNVYVATATYQLDDRSTWMRTLILTLEGSRAGAIAVYRYPLGEDRYM